MCCCSFKHIISLTFKYLLSQSSTGRTFFPNNDCSASNTSANSSISDTGRKLGASDHSVLPWHSRGTLSFESPIFPTHSYYTDSPTPSFGSVSWNSLSILVSELSVCPCSKWTVERSSSIWERKKGRKKKYKKIIAKNRTPGHVLSNNGLDLCSTCYYF